MQQSHNKDGTIDCRPFIDFMLNVIENSMYQYIDSATETNIIKNDSVNDPVNSFDVLELIKTDPHISYEKLVEKTGYWKVN